MFFIKWAISGPFFFIFVFSILFTANKCSINNFLSMNGFEPWTTLQTEPQPLPLLHNVMTFLKSIQMRSAFRLDSQSFHLDGKIAFFKSREDPKQNCIFGR